MQVNLPPAARVALLLLSVYLAGSLFIPNLRSYGAHRLVLAAEDHQLWGRLGEAQESLQEALSLTPLDAELYRTLGDLETVRYQWQADPLAQERTLAAYATSTALNPLDGKLFAAYAEALLQAERFEASHAALTEALRRDPNNAVYHTLRGRLAETEGNLEVALSAYRRAEGIKPSAERQARIEELAARGN